MVLITPSPTASRRLALILAAALAFAGCNKGRTKLTRVSSPLPVQVAWVVDSEGAEAPSDPPASLYASSQALLDARNLDDEPRRANEWGAAFDTRRATSHRLSWLDDQSRDDGLLMLVELRPYYDNTSQGRYRWIVGVHATVAPAADTDRRLEETFEVPVFLQFTIQGADEAMEAAERTIRRRLEFLVDRLLQDPDGDWKLDGDTSNRRPASRGLAQLPPAPLPLVPDATPVEGPIYFVMLDRFANGNPDNDQPGFAPHDPQGWHGGDLRGLIDHLDHLDELGVRTVWLSPLTTTQWRKAGETGGFHGYWLTDPYGLDPHWGTEGDVKALREALTARDMSLVLDVVTNHTGYESTLREQRPTWFHHHGPVQDWHDPVQAETYDVHGLPDLAHENPEVRDWLLGAARHWIRLARPDGFRMDAVRHVPIDFWSELNGTLAAEAGPGFLLLGELFDGSPLVVADTWNRGQFRQMFDFPLHYAMVDVFCRGAHPAKIAATLELDRVYDDPSGLVTFLDNHDLPRIRSVCGGDEQRVTEALTFQLAMRGIPAVTWGLESGLSGDDEPANRADMVFGVTTPVGTRLAELTALRQTHPALTGTRTAVLTAREDQLALIRVHDDDVVLVAWSREPRTLTVTDAVSGGTDLLTGTHYDVRGGRLTLPHGTVSLVALDGDRDALTAWLDDASQSQLSFAVDGLEADAAWVVGGAPELGGWRPSEAVSLTRAGPRWLGATEVPTRTVLEYKLVAETDGQLTWEDRPNRYVHVQEDTEVTLAELG